MLSNELLDDITAAAPGLHGAGASSPQVLRAITAHLRGRDLDQSVETGSGATTLLFSHLSRRHTAFALDAGSGSIANVRASSLLKAGVVQWVEGPTQRTLAAHSFEAPIQAALLDGPHGFPFPQLEYYFLYPHLEPGALLVLDDIHIRSVHDLYRFLRADAMFDELEVAGRAAFFRRTAAPVFDPLADGWWLQEYNQRLLWRYVWWERLRDAIPPALKHPLRRRRIWIEEPRAGAVVGPEAQVRGSAALPAGACLWLLARRGDQPGWWPQGEAPAATSTGRWSQACKLGEPHDAGFDFEIAAVIVDAAASRHLARSIAATPGRSLPLPASDSAPAIVHVRRTKQT